MLGKKYSYYVNEFRYHGFQLPISSLRGYLVIAADFTITRDEVRALVNNDVVLLSTDHHEVTDSFIDIIGETAEGVVINNQYSFEPDEDRYLSGAGVFYELICSLYPEFKSKELEALVGVTLLSDMRPIENRKAERYLRTTYSTNPEQGYIHYLIASCLHNDFGFGVPKFDRNFIDFNLSPTVNALLRANKTKEAISFILGEGLPCFDAKGLQKQLVADMYLRADIHPFTNVHYVVVNVSNFLDYSVDLASYIGLFCNDYKDKYGGISVLGLVVDNGRVKRASFRGRYDDIYYLAGFRNKGIDAHGHPSAFGIQNFSPTTDIWFELDDLIGDMESTHKSTISIVKTSNLAVVLNRSGASIAMKNCYVRDMFRTYIKYTGSNIKVIKQSYKMEEFTSEDYSSGLKPDKVIKGTSYKYIRDKNKNPIVRYCEYSVDGRTVKSFGVSIEDGIILPILEKGYVQLYVRSELS